MRRTSRLLLRRSLYVLTRIWRLIRPVFGFILIVLALLGVIGWLAYQAFAPRAADPRAALVPPPSAVTSFLEGQKTYNADVMWSAYSPTYQATQLQRGATKETMQATADRERQAGLKYSRYDYLGGVPTAAGNTMYVYAMHLEQNGQKATFPLVMTVDTDGKITQLSLPDLE